jgi:hypothetical protein
MKRPGFQTASFLLIFAACFLLFIAAASRDAEAQLFSQDLTMHSTTTSSGMMGRGGGSSTGTDYLSKNAIKTSSSDGTDSIIRFDTQKLITIDNKKKTYSEITFQELQDMINKVGAAAGQMNDEDMAMMKKMMGQMATSFSVAKVGPGETIAGYATEKYLLKGPIEAEISAASDLKMPATYYDVMKFQMPSMPMFDMGKMYEEMKKISGFPLKTVTTMKMMGNEMKTTKVVTSIEKGAIPASVFEIPAGYKRVEAKLK